MKYESQKIAYAYFLTAMILFIVQVSGGLLAGWVYVSRTRCRRYCPSTSSGCCTRTR